MTSDHDRREFMKLALMGTSAAPLLAQGGNPVPKTSSGNVEFKFTRRDSEGKPVISSERIDPRKIGIVVVDMWNYHWCATALGRAGALIPRMNATFEQARELGMTLIFLPTDVILSYVGYPQRNAVLALPHHDLPAVSTSISRPPLPKPPAGGGSCMCGPGESCVSNMCWTALNPELKIRDRDFVAAGEDEMYDICQARGLSHLIYAGIHTNICVIGKPGAAVNMARLGLKCLLARDLTDAFTRYIPQIGYTPDRGTSEIIRQIERDLVPTVDLYATLQNTADKNLSLIVDPVRITPWGRTFEDAVTVTLSTPHTPDAEIHYTLDGSEPGPSSPRYQEPFVLRENADLRAIGIREGRIATLPGAAVFNRLPPVPPMPSVFLSEIQPTSASQGWPYDKDGPQINRSIVGKPLQIRGTSYDRGIGIAAASELLYLLKPEYERFVALTGLDDEILGNDNGWLRACYPRVVFRVFVDDKLVAETPMMRVQHMPWPINIEIPRGSRELRLEVVDGSGGVKFSTSTNPPKRVARLDRYNYMCHADWLNAGFVLRTS